LGVYECPQPSLVLVSGVLAAAHPLLYPLDAGDPARHYLGPELVLKAASPRYGLGPWGYRQSYWARYSCRYKGGPAGGYGAGTAQPDQVYQHLGRADEADGGPCRHSGVIGTPVEAVGHVRGHGGG